MRKERMMIAVFMLLLVVLLPVVIVVADGLKVRLMPSSFMGCSIMNCKSLPPPLTLLLLRSPSSGTAVHPCDH